MYKFLLSDERTLYAVDTDTNEETLIQENIDSVNVYGEFAIALEVNKDFSTFYKISNKTLEIDKVVEISRNSSDFQELFMKKCDKIIEMSLYNYNLVYIVRKNWCPFFLYTGNQIDCLMITNIITKETRQLHQWNVRVIPGSPAIGILDSFETPKIHLEKEWIHVTTTFKCTNPYNGILNHGSGGRKNFKTRYDGTKLQNL